MMATTTSFAIVMGKRKQTCFCIFQPKLSSKQKEKAHLNHPSNRWASLRSTVNRITRYKRTLAETKTVEDGKKGLIPQNVNVRASSNGSVQFVDGPPNWMSSNREVINFWKTILVIVLAWGGRVCLLFLFPRNWIGLQWTISRSVGACKNPFFIGTV